MNRLDALVAVMDAVPVLISYVDRDERYVFANLAYQTWFGRSRSDIVGRTLVEFLGPDRYATIRGHVDKALAGQPVTFETAATRRDGARRIMRAVYVPDTTEAGVARGYIGLVTDITDVRAGETALREETEALEALVRLGRDLAAEVDGGRLAQLVADGALTVGRATFAAFVTRTVDERGERYAVAAVSGIPRDALGEFPTARAIARLRPMFRAAGDARVIRLPEDVLRHLQVRTGAAVPVVARAAHAQAVPSLPESPVSDALGVLVLGHAEPGAFGEREERLVAGVAAQAALAMHGAQQRRARAEDEGTAHGRDEFLTTLSHELRTPLGAVLGWVRLLREGGLTPAEEDRALEVIERNAKVQLQLVEELLDISRIVSGKARLDIRPVHPVTVIDAVVDSMRPAARANAITLETSLDLRAGPIAADPARMQQVLWNLLANSLKFTGREGRIDVRLTRGARHVEIAVSDTGEGIGPDVLPHVFERFRQGDSSTTRRHGGLGLGLALVKHLVEAHGGTVTAHSDGPGHGAVFTVRLPLLGQHDPALMRRAPVEPRTPFGPRLDGCRVLAVDDDADALDLLSRVLDRVGATVHTAASVADALEVVAATPLDVVLADLQMPGDDGFALIERLRVLRGPSGRVPAVAVTAHGSIEDRVRVLAAGFDAHLAKPVDNDELVAVIRRLLARAEGG